MTAIPFLKEAGPAILQPPDGRMVQGDVNLTHLVIVVHVAAEKVVPHVLHVGVSPEGDAMVAVAGHQVVDDHRVPR